MQAKLNDIQVSAGQNDDSPNPPYQFRSLRSASTNRPGYDLRAEPQRYPEVPHHRRGVQYQGRKRCAGRGNHREQLQYGHREQHQDRAELPDDRPAGVRLPVPGLPGIASDSVNADNAIIVSDQWYTDHSGTKMSTTRSTSILQDVSTINQTEANIDRKVNRNSDVIRISDASSRLSTITSTLGTITTFIMAIGGISLVVAAVSIFNVMMMSVKERVQEIGILLSIGTEKGEVRRMFLYEALILGLIGAIVGGIMSFLIGYTVVQAMIGSTAIFLPS